MAKILIVDNNPEQRRLLNGLFRYRTSHAVVNAQTCFSGARACLAEQPDLILINVLLFMANNFAFFRVLQEHAQTDSIPVLVHSAGALEKLTRRRVEASGAAGILELPLSADELVEEIERAFRKVRSAKREVRPVTWPQAAKPEKTGASKPAEGQEVRPVDWTAVASSGRSQPRAEPARPRVQETRRAPQSNAGREGFRTPVFESVDESEVKANREGGWPAEFQQQTDWPSADPSCVVNRPGRRKR